jgi:hypothetical protein
MRAWTVLFLVVAFASGAASGFFVGRTQAPRCNGALPSRAEVLAAFVREVGLDGQQRVEFEKVFEANHDRFTSIKRRVEPELAAVRSDVRTQLRSLLREDQKPRFDKYCNERDRQRDETMR